VAGLTLEPPVLATPGPAKNAKLAGNGQILCLSIRPSENAQRLDRTQDVVHSAWNLICDLYFA